MDPIKRLQSFIQALYGADGELARRLSAGACDEAALRACCEEVRRLRNIAESALDQWQELHRLDPTHQQHSQQWIEAGAAVRGWEDLYLERAYQPAKVLGIELPKPGTLTSRPMAGDEGGGPLGRRPEFEEYAPPDRDVYLGRERHWDRDPLFDTFVGMIKSKPKYSSFRILGIQGPGEAGLDSLMDRLEAICIEKMRDPASMPRPVLYARVQLKTRMTEPYQVATEVLAKLEQNAENSSEETVRSQCARFKEKRREINEQWRPGTRSRALPSEIDLAEGLAICLKQSAEQCTTVILLENFELLHPDVGGRWLRDEWLKNNAGKLQDVVVVVAGEAGLADLAGSAYTRYEPLPRLKPEDLLEWAREECDLSVVTEETVRTVAAKLDCNPTSFSAYVDAWKVVHPPSKKDNESLAQQ
jgi:hypothetical protein